MRHRAPADEGEPAAGLKRRAALQGYSPEHGMTKVAPHGFAVKGVSTYFDADGKQRGQWVKTREDRAVAEQIMRDFVRELTEDIRGKAKPVPAPKLVESDLLVVYPMGDPHFGMYAWADETGDDFDLEIADRITAARHYEIVTPAEARRLRHRDPVEVRSDRLTVFPIPAGKGFCGGPLIPPVLHIRPEHIHHEPINLGAV